jgi:hypothetical protein
MPDTVGRIADATVINSGQTFPLTTQYPFGFSVERQIIVHRFGSLRANRPRKPEKLYSFFFREWSFSLMKLRISSAIPRSFSHCSR